MEETGFGRSYIPWLCFAVLIVAPVMEAQLNGNVRTNEQIKDLFLKEMKDHDRAKNTCKWGTYYSTELQTCRSCDTYCPNKKITGECRKCAAFFNEKKLNETTLRLNDADDILLDKIKSQQADIQKLSSEVKKQQNSTQVEISQLKEDLQEQKQINQDQRDEIERILADREKDRDTSQRFETENQIIKAKLAEFKAENKTLRKATGRLNSKNDQLWQVITVVVILAVIAVFFDLALVMYLCWFREKTPFPKLQLKCRYKHVNPEADAEAAQEVLNGNPQQPYDNAAPIVPQDLDVEQPGEYNRRAVGEQMDVIQE